MRPFGVSHFALVALLCACVGCDNASPPPRPVQQVSVSSDGSPSAMPTMVAALRQRLAHEPLLAGSNIRISATDAGIRLSGFVHSTAAKLRAHELAQEIGGSVAVDNRLVVRRLAGVTETSSPQMVLL